MLAFWCLKLIRKKITIVFQVPANLTVMSGTEDRLSKSME